MAKKKKRSANVARKREKRNRNQKSKHKQLALEKQRKLQFSKLDEEGIFDLLMKSRSFVLEPEFENVHFDFDKTTTQLSNYIQISDINSETNSQDEEDDRIPENIDERNNYLKGEFFQSMDDVEVFVESFLTEAMPSLITPEIIGSLKVALSSCEKRFKRTGDRSQAEAAFVARTFFDVAPKDQFIEHPIFEGILINTIRLISTQQHLTNTEMHEEQDIDTDIVITNIQNLDEPMLRNQDQVSYDFMDDTSVQDIQNMLDGTISNKYPVNALYRNCIGVDIIELLDDWETKQPETYNTIHGNASGQVIENYVHVTADRLHLFAHSNEDLTIAMDALETYCQSAVMFLAKTIDEGGHTDGTE